MKTNGKLIIDQKDLFVYDLDMTLVCTKFNFFYEAIMQTIATLRLPVPKRQEIWDFWYGEINRTDFIKNRLGLEDEMVFWNLFRTFDTPQARAALTVPYPHVIRTLRHLKAQGKKQAIVTASVMPNAQAEIALLKFDFDLVVSVSETPHFESKPDPQSLLHIMNELGVPADKTVMTGDSSEDECLAANAQVDFVHCKKRDPYLEFPRQPLASFGCWSEFSTLEMHKAPS